MPIHPEEYRLEMFVREAGREREGGERVCVRVRVREVQVGEGGGGGVSPRCTHVESDNKKKVF